MDVKSTQLQAATNVLRELHRRNKNQHRHSQWWKWFSLLKRCITKFLHEIQAKNTLRVQAYKKYLNHCLFPRCYV